MKTGGYNWHHKFDIASTFLRDFSHDPPTVFETIYLKIKVFIRDPSRNVAVTGERPIYYSKGKLIKYCQIYILNISVATFFCSVNKVVNNIENQLK